MQNGIPELGRNCLKVAARATRFCVAGRHPSDNVSAEVVAASWSAERSVSIC